MSPAVTPLKRKSSTEQEYRSWLTKLVPKKFLRDHVGPDPHGRYSLPPCRVALCPRISHSSSVDLCRVHGAALADSGDDLDTFLRSTAGEKYRVGSNRYGAGLSVLGIFDLGSIENATVRVELAYGLSQRGNPDNGYGPAIPGAFNKLVAALNTVGTTTLLDLSGEQLGRIEPLCGGRWVSARALITQTVTAIRIARGDNDVRIRLGVRRGGSSRFSRHQDVDQPWLRDLVARWVQFRLNTEAASAQHIGQQEAMLVHFAAWCSNKDVSSPNDFTRALLVDWLGYVRTLKKPSGKPVGAGHRAKFITTLEQFIEVIRVEFGQRVPDNARYLKGERPTRPAPQPRFLEPHVIETLRQPQNLQLIIEPARRLAITIMMHVGIRAGHTCALPFDCLRDLNSADSNDKWALNFIDTKSQRNMMLPLAPEIADLIRDFQAQQITCLGHAPELLFYNANAPKTKQLAPEQLNVALSRWVAELNLREADGSLVNVTPHRFRHTFATEMLEKGVPIDVVSELLGHRNLTSTQIYATVTNKRLREEWEKSQVVNVRGDAIAMPAGAEADAEWLLHRIGRAIQPLPNGYCGLPIQQTCPHANACLDDCDHFMTTKDFLPVLVEQRDTHARFVSKAEREGHLRIAEINRRPMNNLNRIIRAVESASDVNS